MEEWKEIFDGYLVSTLGNVDSTKFKERRRLKSWKTNGYLYVSLWQKNKRTNYLIHRLVAQAFIPNPNNKREVNHINGIKTDNRVENLEWVTPFENTRHAHIAGLAKSGEDCSYAKLSAKQIVYIRDNPDELDTVQLADKVGISHSAISAIQLGQRWKNVGGAIRKSKVQRVPNHIREQIRQLYIKGNHKFGAHALGRKFNCGATTVRTIVNEK